MRFIRFARHAALSLTLAATSVAVATPASALGTQPAAAPLFDGSVYAIAYRGSVAYVGGSFTSVISGGRTFQRQRLAAVDTRTGALLNWAPAADRTVRSLAVSGSSVYLGGAFQTVNGLRRDTLAQVDGTTGRLSAFSHRITGSPYSLAVANGRLYAGGSFTDVDDARRANLAAFSLTTGALDTKWKPRADDAVHTVAPYGSRVYVGGTFHKINDVSGSLRVAALSATGGSVDRSFLPTSDAQVNSLAVDGTGVYAATGGQGGRVLAWTTAGRVRWQRLFDGDTTAVTRLGGVTYVGGHFDRACLTLANGPQGTCTQGSTPRVKLAAINSTGGLTGWAPKANGVIGVRTLVVDPVRGTLGAGGDFTTINGQPRKRYASFA